MPNIWHLAHQITKTTLHQFFQISKNLRHGYSTVSNMRRYGDKCYTLFTLFNPFFLSPFIRCLSCLSVSFSRSLCFGMSLPLHLSLSLFWPSRHRRSHHADLAIVDLATLRDRDRPARHRSRPTLRRRGTPV